LLAAALNASLSASAMGFADALLAYAKGCNLEFSNRCAKQAARFLHRFGADLIQEERNFASIWREKRRAALWRSVHHDDATR
jgi:hypothetical protein